jgi:hypothetical protein
MRDWDRLARLRAIAARVENLPRGHERDELLLELRSRIVALETGSDPSSAWQATHPGPQAAASAAIAMEFGVPRFPQPNSQRSVAQQRITSTL